MTPQKKLLTELPWIIITILLLTTIIILILTKPIQTHIIEVCYSKPIPNITGVI